MYEYSSISAVRNVKEISKKTLDYVRISEYIKIEFTEHLIGETGE